MKNKIIVVIVVLLAGAVCLVTFAYIFKTKPPTVPTPEPVVNFGDVPKEYTLAEVSAHNKKESCWTAIRGKVYDLSTWIAEHPGGSQAILGLCGIDGTEPFTAQHGGQKNPEKNLANFEIGTLKN